MTNPLDKELNAFEEMELKHWHTKSSSFERLPDSTKDQIREFLRQALPRYARAVIEEAMPKSGVYDEYGVYLSVLTQFTENLEKIFPTPK